LQDAIRQARIAARSDVTVLVTGESGTGKEIFAQSIHNESSRADKPFVSLNCSAISRELVESELFGHAPGSFTGALKGGALGKFQLADGGTLFLDEIGEMPLYIQAKLLRVISEKEVVRVGGGFPESINTRLILATNRTLSNEVDEGNFREDLFYRIASFTIRIPSLRQRPEDISLLAAHFAEVMGEKNGHPGITVGKKLLHAMNRYSWPGNVRELQGILEREVLHLEETENQLTHVADRLLERRRKTRDREVCTIEEMEKRLILQALGYYNRDMEHTANALGISRATLYRKLKSYEIQTNHS
jgi:transcriptional regulator with PAS, ATPase and Fis domain